MLSETFVCPYSDETPAKGANAKAVADELRKGKHCSYIYTGNGDMLLKDVAADAVLVYEPISNHGKDGANIFYGDGHVEWKDPAWMKAWNEQFRRRGLNPGPIHATSPRSSGYAAPTTRP